MRAAISVVIPVYNSAATLPGLLDRLIPVLERIAERWEVLCVNDGSRDRSWSVIQDLASRHSGVRGINLLRNYGQHNALLCGTRAARYAITVTIDDDLQNPPEELPRMLAKLDEGFDAVYGTPAQSTHGLLRHLASRLTKLTLQRALGEEIAGQVSSFRMFRTHLREGFAGYNAPKVFLDALLSWSGTRFASIPVRNDPRLVGESNYTAAMLVGYALNMLTSFTTVPLRLATFTGFAFTVFGFGLLVYILLEYLRSGSPVPGFPFIASMIAIFSGAQMFSLGIMGEYLARIHSRTMDRPAYAVHSLTDDAQRSRLRPESEAQYEISHSV
jgi:glycosyltransferase involved in cell wall biosynthesis